MGEGTETALDSSDWRDPDSESRASSGEPAPALAPLSLTFPEGWLDDQLMTAADLAKEVELAGGLSLERTVSLWCHGLSAVEGTVRKKGL